MELNVLGGSAERLPLVAKTIEAVKECPSGDEGVALMHQCIDRHIGRAAALKVTEENEAVVDALTTFAVQAVRHSLAADEILADLKALGAGDAKGLALAVLGRATDLRAAAIRRASAISQRHLSDFDWKVQTVLSSDTAASLNEPRLVLSLTLKDASDAQDVVMELSKPELDNLIAQLEKANDTVLSLRVA